MKAIKVLLLLAIFSSSSSFRISDNAVLARKNLYKKITVESHRSNLDMKAAISAPSIALKNAPKSLFRGLPNFDWKPFIALCSALLLRGSSKLQSKLKQATNAMENEWVKRGSGSSFARTLEVWAFAISFLFKYVR